MNEPSKSAVAAWVQLVRAHRVALGAVQAALKAADLPPLEWYDVLIELERARSGGLRPGELERRLLLPQYGVSRLLDRMARAGFVAKAAHAEDGRGLTVRITDAGRAERARIWPVYAAALAEAIGERIEDEEAETLAALLTRIARRDDALPSA